MAPESPTLLVVTGPPGSGKSTVSRLLVDRFDKSVLVVGDAFFGFVERGSIDPWLPESNEQNEIVTRAAGAAAGRYALGGYTTVYDGVVGPWFLPTFLRASGLEALHYAILLPSVDRCLARVDSRIGHGFRHEGVTRQMHDSFATGKIDRRHVFVDPPDDPRDVADAVVAALDRGSLRYRE